jgi:hypothetical protein
VQSLFWEGSFAYRERLFTDAQGIDSYLADFVAANTGRSPVHRGVLRRLRERVRR